MPSNQFPATPQRTDHVEDRESVIIDGDNDDVLVYDEVSSGSVNGFSDFIHNGMVKVQEGSHDYKTIKEVFVGGMGTHANHTNIVAIHKNVVSDPARKARWLSFQIFTRAVGEKSGNNGNVQFAWYGSSREELCQIISRGFNRCNEASTDQLHGIGIHLSPAGFPIDCIGSSVVDANGLGHMLLCRVILGKMEEIPADSKQFQPNSTEFDSGVDNLHKPRRYIIWNAFMNSHIFPTYIISFKAPSFNGIKRNQLRKLRPTSPWLSFPVLLHLLSKCLEPSKMALISKHYDDFKKNKISRLLLIQRVRQISGDRLLVQIIGRHRNRAIK
ncbi:conserved hypothetical protein [Ricinus communis]|uniref:Uncharacterized protein n=1 Tax=Ricinus communis TaxID=3988 RepID=B9SHA5_RICCO|nr:conserved hypothetical protein [Ricinus communis]